MLLVYNNYSVYAACNIQETLFAHDVGLLQTVNAECDPVCTCVESCSDWNNLSFFVYPVHVSAIGAVFRLL